LVNIARVRAIVIDFSGVLIVGFLLRSSPRV